MCVFVCVEGRERERRVLLQLCERVTVSVSVCVLERERVCVCRRGGTALEVSVRLPSRIHNTRRGERQRKCVRERALCRVSNYQ